MIVTYKHKDLRAYIERGDASKLTQSHLKRLRFVLAKLNTAATIEDMNFHGSGLHPLKGDKKNFWSVRIDGGWRLIFQFEDGDAFDVDYINYH
jgi:proteic killer suppression protein